MSDDEHRGPYRTTEFKEEILPSGYYRLPVKEVSLLWRKKNERVELPPVLRVLSWIEHPLRRKLERKPTEQREFRVWRIKGRTLNAESAMKMMAIFEWDLDVKPPRRALNPWLPANQVEAYDFACHSSTADVESIVIPGATTKLGESLYVLALIRRDRLRTFELMPFDTYWRSDVGFLFVRSVEG